MTSIPPGMTEVVSEQHTPALHQREMPIDGGVPAAIAVNGSKQAKKDKKSNTTGNATISDGGNAAETPKEKTKDGKEGKKSKDDMTIDDLLLPRTLISRLSRGSLPPNTSLQKDALLALTKSATVFISYLAHTANSLTSRKTIQADDILKAISEMELDGVMRDRLEKEIQLFEEGVRGKRKGYRDRVKARESGVSQLDGTEMEAEGDERSGEHIHKRQKRDGNGVDDDDDVEMGNHETNHAQSGATGLSSSSISKRTGKHVEGGNNPDDVVEDDEDDPSAQLQAEASRAAQHDADETESEADLPDNDGDDNNEDEEEEDDDDDDDDDGVVENEDENEDDEDEGDDNDDNEGNQFEGRNDSSRRRQVLAPDGRAEVGGSDDDDSD